MTRPPSDGFALCGAGEGWSNPFPLPKEGFGLSKESQGATCGALEGRGWMGGPDIPVGGPSPPSTSASPHPVAPSVTKAFGSLRREYESSLTQSNRTQ